MTPTRLLKHCPTLDLPEEVVNRYMPPEPVVEEIEGEVPVEMPDESDVIDPGSVTPEV